MRAMRRARSNALSPVSVLCGAVLLLGCGSGTKTVTASSAPEVTQPTTTATSPAKTPTSAKLRVVSQSDTEVTVAYPLYRRNDALCCPGGGQATVRFQLNNGRLTPLDPIPSLERRAG